jgi:hypothetical protein
MAASSAASKQNFSTNGFIHSKLQNSLKEEIVQKLLFIKSNALNLEKDWEGSEDNANYVESISSKYKSSSSLPNMIEYRC